MGAGASTLLRWAVMGAALVVPMSAVGSAMADGPTVERVSVASDGTQGSGIATGVSAGGRFVVFHSAASLVPGDAAGRDLDVFVRDRMRGTTEMVSVSTSGAEGDANSWPGDISANGRYVAFTSDAGNLVPHDTNDARDVFVRDRVAQRTFRASVSSAGTQTETLGHSWSPSISANGRFVAFVSGSHRLVRGDRNNFDDVFVRDLVARTTRTVSVSSAGRVANQGSTWPKISAKGRFVAFSSSASNLVAADTNRGMDVFVRDRVARTTRMISVRPNGSQVRKQSHANAISATGRFVVLQSRADLAGSGDTDQLSDVFVYDRRAGRSRRVSVSSTEEAGNLSAHGGSISADGRYVVFWSNSSNLVSPDVNGGPDAFVRDRATGTTRLVDQNSLGEQPNDARMGNPFLSADGRFVVLTTSADNMVPDDTNFAYDAFVRGPLQ